MIIAGLTGSIAMGKSETAKQFLRRGIRVFDSDSIVHQLYAKGGDAVGVIAKLAPATIVDHAVDRHLLSQEIRNKPGLLAAIEQAVHPLVRMRQEAFLQQARAEGHSLVILDIPLLFETARDRDVGKIIVVMQRLHEDDLTGHLLSRSTAWTHSKIQAQAEEEGVYRLGYAPDDVFLRRAATSCCRR